jgi:hypothetical protein
MRHDGEGLGRWPGSTTLSPGFFATLVGHAVPLDGRAVEGLQASALALDVYAWLAHRLCRVRRAGGVKLSWRNLRDRFGQEYACPKNFEREFRAALLKVSAVYPAAQVEDEIGGLRLRPSPPPIARSRVVVSLPGRPAREDQRLGAHQTLPAGRLGAP